MVSVIIINYNTFQLTCDCISSVFKFTKGVPFEIILVDNASTERNPSHFLEKFPSIKLIESKKNLGFAGGNNLGIQHAKGDTILLLNSDTLLTEDSISLSVAQLQKDPSIGVLGCRQLFPDGALQYSARRFRSISWELLDLFRFVLYFFSPEARAHRMLGQYFLHDESLFVDWVNGAFFLFPRRLLNQLPQQQLDERFFMYAEDVLWCEQIKQAGYRVFFLATTSIIHITSGSTAISKQLRLRKVMMKHEMKIMELRKGKGLYYYAFGCIYLSKEYLRLFVKWAFLKITGKLIR
ncbi:MAG: glycosyltransferase family 2 protein [Chitinophagaceae bacterium]